MGAARLLLTLVFSWKLVTSLFLRSSFASDVISSCVIYLYADISAAQLFRAENDVCFLLNGK